jgi:SHS2 domain-containing protein
MPYEYVEDAFAADIGFRATGRSLEALFTAAADATMNVMVTDLDEVSGLVQKRIRLEAASTEMLLFDFLGEVVFYKDAEQLLLRVREIAISGHPEGTALTAVLRGEPIDPERHHLGVDVKAVTLHRFKVERTGDRWSATVVLDI